MPAPPHALPREQAGCAHIAGLESEKLLQYIARYSAGVRWGRRIRDGQIRPSDGADDTPKRTRVRAR